MSTLIAVTEKTSWKLSQRSTSSLLLNKELTELCKSTKSPYNLSCSSELTTGARIESRYSVYMLPRYTPVDLAASVSATPLALVTASCKNLACF